MIALSLNTGIRQGALYALEWRDVDFENRVLTLRANSAKSGKVNYVPLNEVAFQTLSEWRTQVQSEKLVFPSVKTGGKMDNCRKAWANLLKDADIEKFRWHDMRHDFASQLVMKGVDLNTVRELLGHADLKMTLRYAHLAPKVKRAAVEMLG
jgi:integrase